MNGQQYISKLSTTLLFGIQMLLYNDFIVNVYTIGLGVQIRQIKHDFVVRYTCVQIRQIKHNFVVRYTCVQIRQIKHYFVVRNTCVQIRQIKHYWWPVCIDNTKQQQVVTYMSSRWWGPCVLTALNLIVLFLCYSWIVFVSFGFKSFGNLLIDCKKLYF